MIYLFLTILLAVFTQSLTGFGSGLISMVILPGLIGIQVAVPLVALMMLALEIFLLFRYRNDFRFEDVWRIGLAAVITIPAGVWALRSIDEKILISILGSIMVFFASYSLLNLRMPGLQHPAWGILAGVLAGLFGGAYSIAGPPVIIYASCRKWKPEQFKGNLQSIFLLIDSFSVINHWIAGNMTAVVVNKFFLILPAMVIGLLAGSFVERTIHPGSFRKIVLFLLLAMGLRWIVSIL